MQPTGPSQQHPHQSGDDSSRRREFAESVAAAVGNQPRAVVVVLELLDELDDVELELELEALDGRVVDVETDGDSSSSKGA